MAVLCTQPALLARRPVDLAQSFPETERPVAGGRLGRNRQAAALEVEQHFAPGLGALPVAVGDRQQLLAAPLVGADDDQDTLFVVLHPGLEIDPVGPEIEIAPDILQARDRRGREPWRVRPQKSGQGLGEVARRDALQVEPGQELLDRLGPPEVGRQDRRGETDLAGLSRTPAVAHPGAAHRDRPDAGLNLALAMMAVANDTVPARRPSSAHIPGRRRRGQRASSAAPPPASAPA